MLAALFGAISKRKLSLCAPYFAIPIQLGVKTRLVINAFFEQFRLFSVPVFQGLNGRDVLECALRDQMVVGLGVFVERGLQFSG